ncbi:MAG: GNAT family N-acetyltransferase [Flavobacteriaceae bacterium]|nr:GNAT family N-acetyltransferase [Flavobacteriaceae bacterium]
MFKIKPANNNDIDFVVESIISAEKNNSNILSYKTIFGLNDSEAKKFIKMMVLKKNDGCELSLSSYLIAYYKSKPVGAIGAWIEGEEGFSSKTIKGNLLMSTLPKKAFLRAKEIHPIVSELFIEYLNKSFCIGIVYIKKKYRGKGLVKKILDFHIKKNKINEKKINTYVQVFGNNISAIKTYKKYGFKEEKELSSFNKKIIQYLPSNKKILLIKKHKNE